MFEVKYPNTFYDFSDEVGISDEEINRRVSEFLNQLKDVPHGIRSFRTGNTFVIVTKYPDDVTEVIVSKNYKAHVIYE